MKNQCIFCGGVATKTTSRGGWCGSISCLMSAYRETYAKLILIINLLKE
jgi:hypothetical protein